MILLKLTLFQSVMVGAGVVFIFYVLREVFRDNPTRQEEPQTNAVTKAAPRTTPDTIGQAEGYFENGFFTKIAGVKFRCSARDDGAFLGLVKPQPDNEHDSNARAIYRSDGKHLGYIPAEDLPDYIRYAAGETCTCVGYIRAEDDGVLYGRVKAFRAGDDIDRGIASFTRWMVSTYGRRYIPKGMNIEGAGPLNTDAQVIAALDQYIEDLKKT